MLNLYKKIENLQKQGIDFALCTIVSTKGSVPLGTGSKMIVCEDSSIYGTVGGGYVEKQAIDNAINQLKKNSTKLLKIILDKKSGTCCGGKVEIFIEPMLKPKKLFIFGGGHVCKALLNYLPNLHFDTEVIDDREDIFDDQIFTNINTTVSDFDTYLNKMDFSDDIFVIIITYSHSADYQILSYGLQNKWQYMGMMGSMNKVKKMTKRLLNEGISKETIERVDMPIGKDIKAQTANEIAISIIAELIEKRAELNNK